MFDWKDKILPHAEQEKVAQAFLGSGALEGADGWFRPRNGVVKDSSGVNLRVGIAHSRVIIEQEFPDQDFQTFGRFRDFRAKARVGVDDFLRTGAQAYLGSPAGSARFAQQPPNPFVYVYPLVVLDGDSEFFRQQFQKSSDRVWNVPFDNSTSCFFVRLEDDGLLWGRDVFLRISGASIVLGARRGPSNQFINQIVNMVYYSGLYQMTRETQFQSTLARPTLIHCDLEPLLERQGAEIARVFTQRSTEQKLTRVTTLLVVLTVALVAATIVVRVF